MTIKYVTTKQMKTLDRLAIERFGIPSILLMENAGRGIANLAESLLRDGKKILVVCGKGNNGGDGVVAARHLANRGCRVRVVLLARPGELKEDPALQFNILKKMGVPLFIVTLPRQLARVRTFVTTSDLVLDGIFGVGLVRPVSGLAARVIDLLNESGKQILAIDVPSGLNSDTGEVLGIAVRAKQTGTLGAAKRGLLVREGPKHSGRIKVLDISIPRTLIQGTINKRQRSSQR